MKNIIPRFTEYLNESYISSAKTNEYVKMMNYVLNMNKKHGAEFYHIFSIPLSWNVYNEFVNINKKDKGEQSACYENALSFSKKTGMKLCIGAFIDKKQVEIDKRWVDSGDENKVNPYFAFYPHAWNITDKNEIYDITIAPDLNKYIYVGHEVDANKFQKGFGDLSTFLSKELNMKSL